MKDFTYAQQPQRPEEMPAPGKQPEIPGKDVPDAPMMPPDKPETVPPEKPGINEPAPEIPTQPSHKM